MNRIDQELAEAVEAQPRDEAAPDSKGGVAKPATAPPKPKRNIGLLLGLLAMTGGVTALALSFKESAVYAKSVDQLMADKASLAGRPVRVQGNLVKGTLEHQEQPCEYRFKIASKGGPELPVRFANCVVPDNFRDVPGMDVEVTVEGKLAAGDKFEATNVMAKCPSRYDMQEKAAKGEVVPHGAVDKVMGAEKLVALAPGARARTLPGGAGAVEGPASAPGGERGSRRAPAPRDQVSSVRSPSSRGGSRSASSAAGGLAGS
jgi:cytochrome c-type biogenesis protein CcmE